LIQNPENVDPKIPKCYHVLQMDIIYNPRRTQEILVCLAGGYKKKSKKSEIFYRF
jgi:hypothetical protein